MLRVSRTVVVTGVAAIALTLLTVPAATAVSGTNACVDQIFREWRTGRIAKSHSIACYHAALAALPEDMRVYSDFADQIQRALNARVATVTPKRRYGVAGARRTLEAFAGPNDRRFPLPILVSAIGFAVVVAVGTVLRLRHKLRRGSS
jgi:hypothetical protein